MRRVCAASQREMDMKPARTFTGISRRRMLTALAALPILPQFLSNSARADDAILPSWQDGPAREAILNFVRTTTGEARPTFVPPEDRIATFDQDGTLWVEHPVYTQVVFALDRVVALAPQHPEWRTTKPFSAVLADDKEAIAKFSLKDLEEILFATHGGMDVSAFHAAAKQWIDKARHPRWNRHYTELVYQPMLELIQLLRSNGYKIYIVTGGGQDFVRAYAGQVYGIPPDRIIGSALETQFSYDDHGKGVLKQAPNLLLNNNFSGKPEDIYLFTGGRPQAAFGNSTGDRQMLEYTAAGPGLRLKMLVLHDDPVREYAYGPAEGLPDTKIGTFTQALYDEAKAKGWTVISMKNDWNHIFPWERLALQ
jgi:phosphoserine phosphatase